LNAHSRLLTIGIVPDSVQGTPSDFVSVANFADAAQALRGSSFTSVLVDPTLLAELFRDHQRDEYIRLYADRGICFMDLNGSIVWANSILQDWFKGELLNVSFLQALGSPPAVIDYHDPISAARSGQSPHFRLHRPNHPELPYLDIVLQLVRDAEGTPRQLIALCRNVTEEVEQQKKLDALHRAGRELALLHVTDLSAMNVTDRVELLRHNIRRYIHDLLHYDVMELRLLDRQTGELKPLLEEGMTPEAAKRTLFARPTNNGVTGYVANTGKSYLCADAAHDPHYILGAAGARSSMTIPLIYDDNVVGTLNIESPRVNGFGPDDLQFTELFSREIAAALNTLDLLSAQQNCSVSATIDAVQREIALPIDDILACSEILLNRHGDGDAETAQRLRIILDRVRSLKGHIMNVGREMGSVSTTVGPLATLADPPLTSKRILVIDPDERLRKQAHLVIGRLGATVETTGTALEGLAMLTGSHYDAIFMDIRPPDLGGYETYRRLRDTRPDVQVAMSTGFGYDSGHAIVKARADGMQFVLFKPYRADQVIRAVTTTPLPRGTSVSNHGGAAAAAAAPLGGTT